MSNNTIETAVPDIRGVFLFGPNGEMLAEKLHPNCDPNELKIINGFKKGIMLLQVLQLRNSQVEIGSTVTLGLLKFDFKGLPGCFIVLSSITSSNKGERTLNVLLRRIDSLIEGTSQELNETQINDIWNVVQTPLMGKRKREPPPIVSVPTVIPGSTMDSPPSIESSVVDTDSIDNLITVSTDLENDLLKRLARIVRSLSGVKGSMIILNYKSEERVKLVSGKMPEEVDINIHRLLTGNPAPIETILNSKLKDRPRSIKKHYVMFDRLATNSCIITVTANAKSLGLILPILTRLTKSISDFLISY